MSHAFLCKWRETHTHTVEQWEHGYAFGDVGRRAAVVRVKCVEDSQSRVADIPVTQVGKFF
jgi:hypothetical protein